MERSRQKLEPLQDLRGIAVLLVVLYHAGTVLEKPIFSYGFAEIGVTLFFMISGFVMVHVHGNDRGSEAAIIFFKKRIVRIYPMYLLVFILFLVMLLLSGFGGEYHRDLINIVRNMFLVHVPSMSIHPYSWSLVYEVFYYTIFGIIIIWLGISPVLSAFLISLFPVLLYDFDHDGNMIWISFYNLYFAFGMLVGYYWRSFNFIISLYYPVFSFFCLLGAVYLGLNDAFIFIYCAVFFASFLAFGKSNIFLNYIGTASYSIYLCHALVVPAAKRIFELNYLAYPMIVMLCLIVGVTSYHIFERKMTYYAARAFNVVRR